jgi:peptide/nickel transport system ATP-binding protein/oligopeptide transport system ATP-binding protein
MNALLELSNVNAHYPFKRGLFSRTAGYLKAVDCVSISVYEGETLGLVGESGCGKSTLGRVILRLEENAVTSGSMKYRGREISEMEGRDYAKFRRSAQMIFQDPYSSLPPRKRVREIIAEPMRVNKICPRSEIDDKVESLLLSAGLAPEYKNRYPHEFSGGQRQRIGIARALAVEPEFLICDEPVSALDVSVQAQILNLLKDLQEKLNLTMIFIAHGLGAVKYVSDRLAVMYLGKIFEIGPSCEIFESPQHPYTRALLAANPVFSPHLRGKRSLLLSDEAPSLTVDTEGCRFAPRCPLAEARCRRESPALENVQGEKGEHRTACFVTNGD